jgi:hypothetical protein
MMRKADSKTNRGWQNCDNPSVVVALDYKLVDGTTPLFIY